MNPKPRRNERESVWVYIGLAVVTAVWGFCVAIVCTFFLPWNPYIVWIVATGVANLAITYKVARRRP